MYKRQLEIPRAIERLYIEDYTSAGERELAAERRYNHGEHVIPAPMGDLKRDFAGYFMNPQRFLKNWNLANDETDKYEKTVVCLLYTSVSQTEGSLFLRRNSDRGSCEDFYALL